MSGDTPLREVFIVYDDAGELLWAGTRPEVDRVAKRDGGARITRGLADIEGNVTNEAQVWRRGAT